MDNFDNVTEMSSVPGLSTLPQSGLISDYILDIVQIVNLSVLSAIISTFGLVANVINITVFVKQGFGDSVNVSLLALALSDLAGLITVQWVNLLRNPLFYNSGVPLIPTEVFHLTGGWPHGYFARLTSWITAYITLERCLCVLIPLKVKRVVTPKLAVIVLVSIFVGMVLTLIPDYATAYIDWKFVPERNQSMLGLLFTEGRERMAVLSFTLAAYTQMISYLAVIVFTTILVLKMKENSKWRERTASAGQGTSKRDQKVVNMVILIAVIYCICFLPTNLAFLMTSIIPGLDITGRYHNTFLVCWACAFLVDSVNSTVNIFVYYRMSSKYRATLDDVMKTCKLDVFLSKVCGRQEGQRLAEG